MHIVQSSQIRSLVSKSCLPEVVPNFPAHRIIKFICPLCSFFHAVIPTSEEDLPLRLPPRENAQQSDNGWRKQPMPANANQNHEQQSVIRGAKLLVAPRL